MGHLTKDQKRRIIAIRSDMARYLRELMASVNRGELAPVIEFCNSASVKIDVECLLHRRLTYIESVGLLQTPENTAELFGEPFGRAHAIGLNMKHSRQLCRTLIRQARVEGIGSQLAGLLEEIEAYAA